MQSPISRKESLKERWKSREVWSWEKNMGGFDPYEVRFITQCGILVHFWSKIQDHNNLGGLKVLKSEKFQWPKGPKRPKKAKGP